MKRTLTTLFALALCIAAVGCSGGNVGKPIPEPVITESPLEGSDVNSRSSSFSVSEDKSSVAINMLPLDEAMLRLAAHAYPDKVLDVVNFPDSLKEKRISLEFSVPYRMDSEKMGSVLYPKLATIYGIEVYPVTKDTAVWMLSVVDYIKLKQYRATSKGSGSSITIGRYHTSEFRNKTLPDIRYGLGLDGIVLMDDPGKRGYDLKFSNLDDFETTERELAEYGLKVEQTVKNLEVMIIDGSKAHPAE